MKRNIAAAAQDGATRAPTPFEIELAIDHALDVQWSGSKGRPELSDAKFAGEEDGWHELTFTIEIDGDLELPFEMPDAELMEMLHGGLEGFATYVAAVCADVLSHAVELRAAQSSMRRRVEDFSRSLASNGLELPLGWLSLAPHEHWIKPADVTFHIAFVGLGDHLREDDILGEAGLDDDLTEAFDHALDTQRERSRQVAQVRSAGAHGRADAMALALINADPHSFDALRDVMVLDQVDLQDGITLHWSNGVLRSSGKLSGGIEWFHNHVELTGRWFSAAAAAAMAGRPTSDIVDHPAFSGIAIREVASQVVQGRATTFVGLETPVAFFDASSGRSWPDDAGSPQ